jgi:MFS family permease
VTAPSRTVGIYVGAFLGPFGGNVVQVLLPVLQGWYGVDIQLAALALSAYMVPFAAAQFFSGALADRIGRRPVLVIGFAGFALASLWGALTPTFGGFLWARGCQGLANAFTTPILMAALGDTVESRRLGQALGWFAAVNTAGIFLAPLVSGALAVWDWRLVYLLLAAISAGLTALYARRGSVPDAGTLQHRQLSATAILHVVISPRLAALSAGALLGYLSLSGVGFLVVLHLVDRFGMDVAQSGLILSAFGLANMLVAGPAGAAVDRWGSIKVSVAGVALSAVLLAALPVAPHPVTIAGLMFAGGAAVAGLWAGLTKLAVETFPARRATASSVFSAWKFVGYAISPVLYTPLYTSFGPTVAFTAAAGASAAILLPLGYVAALQRRGQAMVPSRPASPSRPVALRKQ